MGLRWSQNRAVTVNKHQVVELPNMRQFLWQFLQSSVKKRWDLEYLSFWWQCCWRCVLCCVTGQVVPNSWLDCKDEGTVVLQNVGNYSPIDMASCPRSLHSSEIRHVFTVDCIILYYCSFHRDSHVRCFKWTVSSHVIWLFIGSAIVKRTYDTHNLESCCSTCRYLWSKC